MKYVSLDIETSALDPKDGIILSVAAVVDDTANSQPLDKLDYFYSCIIPRNGVKGDPTALAMNSVTLNEIGSIILFEERFHQHKILDELNEFLSKHLRALGASTTKINLAGKNVLTFDLPWIKANAQRGFYDHMFSHRALDPAIFYLKTDDAAIPNMAECLERAGLEDEWPEHHALADAYRIVKLIRHHMAGGHSAATLDLGDKIARANERRLARSHT